ncbi:bifunctional nuclease family protein [Chlamydiifrater phoenicopteri]|uniref:bifunctional nuclease family protein n=1 Tax=Chlamydiifrater phoenicopteri TaxID=2681469 RepID=UPI001BCC0BBC|nr:bifunctional nuclease domain-containing protein [Chlamydiifrater phoenicopteri]
MSTGKTNSFVPLTFQKLVNFRNYAGIVLGNREKNFAIYGHPSMAESFCFRSSVEGIEDHSRPLSHDLLNFVLSGLDVKVLYVLINDYKDSVFYSRIFLEAGAVGELTRIVEVDARPSDSIPLALANKAPVFCLQSVFDSVVCYEE